LHEQGALANREWGFGADAEQMLCFVFDAIGVIGSQLLERRPLLPAPVHELSLVFANRARMRRLIGFAKLCAALNADVIFHSGC
jgi:hypothetical protein